MIKNRPLSFIVLLFVYVLAGAYGIVLFEKLQFDYRLSLLICDVVATIIVFLFSLVFRNASVYDPYWSVQPIVIVTAFAIMNGKNSFGTLLLAAIYFWGIRLTSNWAYTFKGLTSQDWRYTMLKEKTGKFYPFVNFTGIHLIPTLVVYLCVLPAVTAITESFEITPLSIVFAIVSILATMLQGTADFQMHAFHKNGGHGFIRTGVWKKGRHPNYLGEILMWWGIGLSVVCANPKCWYLLAGAVANTCLFLFISIPLAEKHQSRKTGFDDYKKETRLFI